MMRIINATSMGVRNGDKEEILDLCEKLNINIDQADAHWNNFKLYKEKEYNTFTGKYDDTERYVLDVHRLIGDPVTHEYQVMNKEQILNAIRSLAASQGFYGRLYNALTNGSEQAEEFLATMEEQNFGDVVDMVMWLEC